MAIRKNIDLFIRIHAFIKKGGTGTPAELGEKLNLCERQARRKVDEMKEDLQLPIEYSHERHTYYYNGAVFFNIEISVGEGDAKKKILGGKKYNFNFLQNFWHTDILLPRPIPPLY